MGRKELYGTRSRTLKGYIISYTGVVIIALALLSIAAAWQIASTTRKETMRVYQNKLYALTGDMENQFSDMRVTALEIATAKEFSYGWFSENKYREVELLELFKKYCAGSSADSCFLKYQEYGNVFTSTEKTLPLSLYLGQYFEEEQSREVIELIEALNGEGREKLAIYKSGDAPALFLFPLKRYTFIGQGEGVLCFEMSEAGFEKRIEKVAGQMEGEIAIYYEDTLIYGTEPEGKSLESLSDDGKIRAVFQPDEDSFFLWGNIFSEKVWLAFGGIAVVLLAVAFYAAWRSYRPILELTKKYKEMAGDTITYDLDGIDLILETLLRREENSSKRLQEQYQLIREQTVRLIARGGYSDKIGERLSMLNLHLDTAVFCRIQCELSLTENVEEQMAMLCREIEDLSEEGEWIYPFTGEKGILKVLAAMEEEYQADEVAEALRALFEAREILAEVTMLEVCHDIRELNQNGQTNSSSDTEEEAVPEDMDSLQTVQPADRTEKDSRQSGRKKSTAEAAVSYIKENCTKYDLSLDMVADEFHITPTYLCRIIKQQMGVSYKEYLTGLRIEAAKKMLMDENASIADVCQRTGYTNVSHFIKVFQKSEGITPAKYRDEMCGR